jgi:sensor c-di-GMP phosphodiesterase-like protein
MHRPTGVGVAVVVGLAAIAAPIWLSIHLAWLQSLSDEEDRVQSNARDVIRRGDETRIQIRSGQQKLIKANLPPCSPAEIDLMRQIDISSSYVQAVARIQGDNLICTSLGTGSPIPVGPPTLTTEFGATARLKVIIPIAGDQPLDIYSRNGFAFLIHPDLSIDTATEGPDISLALFVPSSQAHPQLGSFGSHLRPEWYRAISKGGQTTFVDHGYIVSIVRSEGSDLAAVAAAPVSYVGRRVTQFAIYFVPLGLICGLALVWAVIYVSRRSLSLPSVLRASARRREFFVEYQPIVEMSSRRWIGAEALVRWRRPDRIIRPDSFIPAAEESGAITVITRCVAAIVTADLPRFLSIDPDFKVAMNLSVADLQLQSTLTMLEEILRAEGARPANLEIEATERGFLQGTEVHDLIAKIRSLGISVAIDDFGTGYSSLSRLHDIALDTLKIDKAFVDTIGTDGVTSGVVLHIIDMAHFLGLELVAEGVETEEQASFLLQRGVRYAQGWLYAKPMPIESLCASLLKAMPSRKQKIPA